MSFPPIWKRVWTPPFLSAIERKGDKRQTARRKGVGNVTFLQNEEGGRGEKDIATILCQPWWQQQALSLALPVTVTTEMKVTEQAGLAGGGEHPEEGPSS